MYLKKRKGGNLKTKNYNLIPLSIENGLNAVQIGTAGGYIRLLDAPSAANVEVHLNEKNADPIPLKVYHAIEATDIERIYVTCNAVAGGVIKIVQANTAADFKMVTPASNVALSALGSYEPTALEQLDKIINPYQSPIYTSGYWQSTTTDTLVFSKTFTCDKVNIKASVTSIYISGSNIDVSRVRIMLDGVLISSLGGWADSSGRSFQTNDKTIIENVKNKTIEVYFVSDKTYKYLGITIEEYTLKP